MILKKEIIVKALIISVAVSLGMIIKKYIETGVFNAVLIVQFLIFVALGFLISLLILFLFNRKK